MENQLVVTQSRYGLLVRSNDGKEAGSTFTTPRHFRQAAKMLGREVEQIEAVVQEFRRKQAEEAMLSETPPPRDPHLYRVRQRQASEGTQHSTFDEALAQSVAVPDAVIEWKDASLTSAVDLDWHQGGAPDSSILLGAGYTVSPAPTYCWLTKSGGLRLIYDAPRADMLAAVAAVRLADKLRPTGIELLTRTRAPRELPSQRGMTGQLTNVLGDEVTDEASVELRDEWLEEHGFTLGQRYDHSHCVIDPNRPSAGVSPVSVTEQGIYCYSCAAHLGRGFKPWGQLVGLASDSVLLRLVNNFVHWEQARLVLQNLYKLPESVLEPFYRACLVSKHGVDDVRIDPVFYSHGILRAHGLWVTDTGEPRNPKFLQATIANLPATMSREGASIPAVREAFLDTPSISKYGYDAVKLIHGIRIGTYHGTLDHRPSLVLPRKTPPTYVPAESRMLEQDARAKIEEALPLIHWPLIELLIVARGYAERDAITMSPMLFIDGVSGSGKTGHAQVAAEICGDRCTDLIPTANDDAMGMRLWEAYQAGSFINVNEAAKGALKAKVDETAFLNFLLHISPQATYRVLYRGYTSLGGCPIILITDIQFDETVLRDGQLGRRAWYVTLGTEPRNWKQSSVNAGLAAYNDLRSPAAESIGLKFAVDSYLSHVIDKHFSSIDTPHSLDEVARELGFKFMNESDQALEVTVHMKDLFEKWRAWPGLKQTRVRRGHKAFKVEPESSELALSWSRLHDPGNPLAWSRANERSWQRATGWAHPLRLSVKPVRADSTTMVQLGFEQQVDGKWQPLEETTNAER